MPRSAVLACLLAVVVAVALTVPQGCHASQAEPNASADTSASAPAPAPSTDLPPREVTEADTVAADTTERPPLPDGFVRLSAVAPEIAQEIRYTTPYNFVGAPIDAYLAPECILTERAATALRDVARALADDGLGLKVYDCYRPQTAVRHFVRWANDPGALAMKDAFYPTEPKGSLFSRGYIATRSGHSRGSTVDLTLVRLPVSASVLTRFPSPGDSLARCDAPRAERLDERDLDMGTAYDCLSTLAATDDPRVSREVRRNRDRLRAAMSAGGFRNYAKEWWHFTLRGEPHRTYFDFPVE